MVVWSGICPVGTIQKSSNYINKKLVLGTRWPCTGHARALYRSCTGLVLVMHGPCTGHPVYPVVAQGPGGGHAYRWNRSLVAMLTRGARALWWSWCTGPVLAAARALSWVWCTSPVLTSCMGLVLVVVQGPVLAWPMRLVLVPVLLMAHAPCAGPAYPLLVPVMCTHSCISLGLHHVYITYDLYIISYDLYIISYDLYIISHDSPMTCTSSPMTCTSSPMTCTSSPMACTSSPMTCTSCKPTRVYN